MGNRLAIVLLISAVILLNQGVRSPGAEAQGVLSFKPSSAAGPQSLPTQPTPTLKASTDYGRMPLYFIANKGQVDEQVDYYVQGLDKSIYFTAEGVTFALSGATGRDTNGSAPKASGRLLNDSRLESQPRTPALERGDADRWVVKLGFVGANRNVRPIGRDETGAAVSYFRGRLEDWHTGVPTYSKIAYANLWPGIDLVYSGTVNQLKYEFVVHPGADPSLIKLAYRGAENIKIDSAGRLEVMTPAGGFRDDTPLAFQETDGIRVNVPLDYQLQEESGPGAEAGAIEKQASPRPGGNALRGPRQYGFRVGDYDKTKPLILDPAVLVYCGYVGGTGYEDQHGGIAVDGSGNAYITGITPSGWPGFPAVVGPDLTGNGSTDAFVAKINASGTGLVYCGYIGGSSGDRGYGIAVDPTGAAYVVGETSSAPADGFPVLSGPSLSFGGATEAFVAKVNPSGTALVYCGYIGGQSSEYGWAVTVDNSGSAYVAGSTESDESTFPVAIGPDLISNGGNDAFVAKVNASGTGLAYCGFVGGNGYESGNSIAVDSGGNAYLAGITESPETSFPVAVGPDLTFNGYPQDGFVAKVNAAGTNLDYCGYIGGADQEWCTGLAVDASGSAYVCGVTESDETTFPVKTGPDLTINNAAGYQEAWVAKVKSDGTVLDYCGYIGGSSNESAMAAAVDSTGCAYVFGTTGSSQSTFPVSGGPDLTINGSADAFVAKVMADGTRLAYCGYIGGQNAEIGYGIAVDSSGSAYVLGQTNTTESTFPVKVGPDLSYNGGYDSFVAKIAYQEIWAPKHAVGDFDGDGADELAVDFGATGIYLYDGGAWSQLSSANPESLLAADVDGDTADEILADLGASGLWLWNAGAWNQLSGVNVEGLAAGDVDADGSDELVGDFGAVGLWLFNAGLWTQLSGVNADYVTSANLDGTGGEEIAGDFGATGLWLWNAGAWTQLSGVNADYVTAGNTDGTGGMDLVGDFGATGLWLWSSGAWTQLSGVNADYMITAKSDGDADDEIVGDFGPTGLWLWNSGAWTILSGINAEYMIPADVDGNGDDEAACDFETTGLWLWNSGAWTQASGVNAEDMLAGDFDGDNAAELMADFGTLGLWMWNAGAWSQVSPLNPD